MLRRPQMNQEKGRTVTYSGSPSRIIIINKVSGVNDSRSVRCGYSEADIRYASVCGGFYNSYSG
jgi:hypothetical protein